LLSFTPALASSLNSSTETSELAREYELMLRAYAARRNIDQSSYEAEVAARPFPRLVRDYEHWKGLANRMHRSGAMRAPGRSEGGESRQHQKKKRLKHSKKKTKRGSDNTNPTTSTTDDSKASESHPFVITMRPHERVLVFCRHVRRGGCSYREANELLLLENKGIEATAGIDEADVLRSTSAFIASRPKPTQTKCDEIHHIPSPTEFLREYVVKSRPVIMRGVVADWPAVTSRPWTMGYLQSRAGNSTVTIFVSMTPDFEYATTMREHKQMLSSHIRKEFVDYASASGMAGMDGGEGVRSKDRRFHSAGNSNNDIDGNSDGDISNNGGDSASSSASSSGEGGDDEIIMVRPAETEMLFSEYAHLSSGQYPNLERAHFYFQKHALSKWSSLGLLEDLSPSLFDDQDSSEGPRGTKRPKQNKKSSQRHRMTKQQTKFAFARFLMLRFHYLWMGRYQSHGNLHFDSYENVLAVVRGKKRFDLYHPLHEGMYEQQAAFRTSHLLYSWDRAGYEIKSETDRQAHGGPAPSQAGKGRFWAIPISSTEKKTQPFSPVNTTHPDPQRHPLFTAKGEGLDSYKLSD
jgi:hypothetical protein